MWRARSMSPGDTVYGAFPDSPGPGCGDGELLRSTICSRRFSPSGRAWPTAHRGTFVRARRYGHPGSVGRCSRGSGAIPSSRRPGRAAGLWEMVSSPTPGNGGATEIVYVHDGSKLVLRGVATVIDCVDHCGAAGSVAFRAMARNSGPAGWLAMKIRIVICGRSRRGPRDQADHQ